ncbi:MAG: sel1 repeat family protein [Gammaproteobacteria bacterium]|nr:sel1 repeat family protein [Gammaproteobacteria bacterium]
MAHLGAMYMLGQGTPVNPKKALPWLERAAQIGHIGTMGTLGMLLATGKGGVSRDMERAVYLMQQAAKQVR